MKQSIIDGYGSEDIASEIDIVSSVLSVTVDAALNDENVEMLVRSYTGIQACISSAKSIYPRVLTLMPLGSNTFEQLYVFEDEEPPIIVTCGAGDYEEQNNTGYGNGLEFWDEDLIWNDGGDQSSYSNGKIAGKLLKIKDALNCDWWTARYLARLTSDRNEPNRETTPWDLGNGYGKINVTAAINMAGTTIPDDPYNPKIGLAKGSSFSVHPDKIKLAWNAVANADGYRIYRKYKNVDEELIDTVTELSFEDVPDRHPRAIQYRVVAYLEGLIGEQTVEVLNEKIFYGIVGKVYQQKSVL